MTLPASVTASLTALGAGSILALPRGRQVVFDLSGTWVGTVRVERSRDGGLTWAPMTDDLTANVAAKRLSGHGDYRLRCTAFTSGTIVGVLAPVAAQISQVLNAYGQPVFEIDDDGVLINGQAPTLASTSLLSLAQRGIDVAAVAAAAALSFGASLGSGLQFMEQEEVVDLTAAGAKFVALTNAIPSGSVILCAQMNLDALVVAGGTSVKVGLGDHSGTCNTYGTATALTKNTKSNKIPAFSVLGSDTTPEVCACASTATGLGDTNFSAGKVRVRIVYLRAVSLPDA